jgi:adenosylmethionine---8-amino-7-oxononanoate aminotransferase
MSNLIVIGTDTDVGKTTFALLWMTAFGDRFAYWKPVETGVSDTETLRQLVPSATVFDPVARFAAAVAPPLAARLEGKSIPSALEIAAARPVSSRSLLIETFGSALSPLNESELQIALVKRLRTPCVVVTNSAVGAVGRSLAAIRNLRIEGVTIVAVVLVGPGDDYAIAEIRKHAEIEAFAIDSPAHWDQQALRQLASAHRAGLEAILRSVRELPEQVESLTRRLIERDSQSVWHPYTPLRDSPPPLPVVAAQDEFLELADGRRLVDAISSWWTILHGHRQPRLMAALQQAAEKFDHVLFAGVTHPAALECAELLLTTAPWHGGRVFFSDNGSTAVEVALKMAYQFWCHRGESHRKLFIGFENAYHGDTFGAMAVGRDPLFFGRFEPLLFRAERVPLSPDRLDETLSRNSSEVAAVIVEPLVQGAGGMRMHSSEVLRDLHAVARRHGVLFIADEVMTAARTGTFWAHTQAGIAPDLICAAKTLAGGVQPIAVTLASPQVVREFDVADRTKTFFHGHSFTAHPLACAVAVENLRLLATGDWQAQSNRIERFWRDHSAKLAELPGVSDVRVCGTILALDLESPGGYLAGVAGSIRTTAVQRGVLLRPLGNVVYALPPLCTSDESLACILDAIREGIWAL